MEKRILVVDDHMVMGEIISETFEDMEITVTAVGNATEAMDYIRSNPTDVVITDIMMPGLNGTELFFRLKDINPFVQIIVMTAYPSRENVVSMIKHGASDFLLKPFAPDDIRETVVAAFNRLERWDVLRNECMK